MNYNKDNIINFITTNNIGHPVSPMYISRDSFIKLCYLASPKQDFGRLVLNLDTTFANFFIETDKAKYLKIDFIHLFMDSEKRNISSQGKTFLKLLNDSKSCEGLQISDVALVSTKLSLTRVDFIDAANKIIENDMKMNSIKNDLKEIYSRLISVEEDKVNYQTELSKNIEYVSAQTLMSTNNLGVLFEATVSAKNKDVFVKFIKDEYNTVISDRTSFYICCNAKHKSFKKIVDSNLVSITDNAEKIIDISVIENFMYDKMIEIGEQYPGKNGFNPYTEIIEIDKFLYFVYVFKDISKWIEKPYIKIFQEIEPAMEELKNK